MSTDHRPKWSGSIGFILAAAGSAVGLGNIWKFPYITGMNGGGAFVLIYLLCIALVGVPVLLSELYIGKTGQANTVKAYEKVHKKGSIWQIGGVISLTSAFLILTYYSVIGGWILHFEWQSILSIFNQYNDAQVAETLGNLLNDPKEQIILHFIFCVLTTGIVYGGVQKGIERWSEILMPGLTVLLFILLIYSSFLPGFSQSLEFLFVPKFNQLTWSGVLEAVGHSFFTLSVAVGVMITYGSYLNKSENLPKMGFTIAILDTIIALTAGVIIFSAVFSYGIEINAGPTLIFESLPVLFNRMSGGYVIATSFFLLVSFTALTSTISILEVVVAFWVETFKTRRKATTIGVGLTVFILGIFNALSSNILSHIRIFGLSIFDFIDKLTSNIFLPSAGLITAIFIGWVLGPKAIRKITSGTGFEAYHYILLFSIRIIVPISISIILILSII